MAVDLLGRLKVFWTREAIQQLSVLLGEQPDHVGQALGLGAPAILAGLTRAAGAADPSGLIDRIRRVPEELARFGGVSKLLDQLAGMGDMAGLDPLAAHGRSELQSLFGDKLDGVIELIATDSGARPATAGILTSLVAPTLMAMLRQHLGDHGLTVDGVRDYLASQRDSILAQAPGSLAKALGVDSLAGFMASPSPLGERPAQPPAPSGFSAPIVHDSPAVAGQPAGAWWTLPLAIAVLAVAAGYYLLPQANPPDAGPEVAIAEGRNPPVDAPSDAPKIDGVARDDVPSSAVTADGRPVVETGGRRISMALPGDASIDVPEGSYLEAVVKMLRDGAAKDARTFAADDLAFDRDSTLAAGSAQPIEQLAIIAKAYPRARLKIEVRESPGGPADADQRRADAQKRADAVRDALTEAGVAADRVAAAVKPADALDAPATTPKTAAVDLVILPE